MVRREPLLSIVRTIARLPGSEMWIVRTITRFPGAGLWPVRTIALEATCELHPARAHRGRPPDPDRVPAVLCPPAFPPPCLHPRALDDGAGLRPGPGVGLPRPAFAAARPGQRDSGADLRAAPAAPRQVRPPARRGAQRTPPRQPGV